LQDQILRLREPSQPRAALSESSPVKDSRTNQLEIRLSEAVSAALAAQAHVSQLQIQYQQVEATNRELQSQLETRQVSIYCFYYTIILILLLLLLVKSIVTFLLSTFSYSFTKTCRKS
jgi:hypothetical protein